MQMFYLVYWVFLAAVSAADLHRDRPVDCVRDRWPSRSRERRGVTIQSNLSNNLWPNCTVPYIVLTDENCGNHTEEYTSACTGTFPESVAIEGPLFEAMGEIRTKTDQRCRFVEYNATAHGGIKPLYVIHNPESCYVQHVGYAANAVNIMNLGWCSTYATIDSIKHELCHILGLEHEHQSPLSSQYLSRCKPEECWSTYNCLALSDAAWQGYDDTLDLRSIMMYPLYSSCALRLKENGSALLAQQNLTDAQVGRLMNISDFDVASILKHYDTPKTSGCSSNQISDCSGDGDCCPARWLGDGYRDCEDQFYGCDLSCYSRDDGDCDPASSTTAPPIPQPSTTTAAPQSITSTAEPPAQQPSTTTTTPPVSITTIMAPSPPQQPSTTTRAHGSFDLSPDHGKNSGLEDWQVIILAVGCAVSGAAAATLICRTMRRNEGPFVNKRAYTRLGGPIY